ncbi:MAG: hypothetical protein KJZ86_22865, partial [Caldilineaceae bacterium]|nr:hypothetical protein [Caldilineaceae bacterium]
LISTLITKNSWFLRDFAIAGLSDEDLQKPYSHYLPNEQDDDDVPIIARLAGYTSEHFDEHLPWIRHLAEVSDR